MSGQPSHPNQSGRINLPPIRQVLSESFPPQQGRPQQIAPPPGAPYAGHYAYPHPAPIQRGQAPAHGQLPHGPIPPHPHHPPPAAPGSQFHVLAPTQQGNLQTRQAGPGTIVRHPHPEGSVTAPRPRRFACNYPGCTQAFDRQAALDNHLRTHTGERPYNCAYCPADFTTNSNLKRHERDQHPY